MSESTNLVLPYIQAAQAQKHVTHNEAIRKLDAVVQLAVLDRNLNAPPSSPNEGDRYIIPSGASGQWSGHDNEIAAYQDGAWMFYPPREGWFAWVMDEDEALIFNATTWSVLSSGGGGSGGSTTFVGLNDTPTGFAGSAGNLALVNSGETALEFSNQVGLLGVNSTPDATNKFSVSSPASLLNHEGSGHQAKINKNAVGDTASFLFQTGFSGRAEIGTTGDDDFHFKVSPDGTAWKEAILVDKATGEVAFPNTALGGGGAVAVEDEGVEVLATASRLNFSGSGVVVTDAGSGEATVTISGAGGAGNVPVGGTQDQVLAKVSTTDFDTAWVTPASGGNGDIDGGSAATSGTGQFDGGNAFSN